jgi:hypothetical protein
LITKVTVLQLGITQPLWIDDLISSSKSVVRIGSEYCQAHQYDGYQPNWTDQAMTVLIQWVTRYPQESERNKKTKITTKHHPVNTMQNIPATWLLTAVVSNTLTGFCKYTWFSYVLLYNRTRF